MFILLGLDFLTLDGCSQIHPVPTSHPPVGVLRLQSIIIQLD